MSRTDRPPNHLLLSRRSLLPKKTTTSSSSRQPVLPASALHDLDAHVVHRPASEFSPVVQHVQQVFYPPTSPHPLFVSSRGKLTPFNFISRLPSYEECLSTSDFFNHPSTTELLETPRRETLTVIHQQIPGKGLSALCSWLIFSFSHARGPWIDRVTTLQLHYRNQLGASS